MIKASIFIIWSLALASLGGWGGWKVRAAVDPILDSRDRVESVANMFSQDESR